MSKPTEKGPKHDAGYPDGEWRYPEGSRRYPIEARAGSLPPGLKAAIERLGPSSVTVLLVGATAALRAAVARALHDRSPRSPLPFEAFDCTGLGATAIERGLFGGPAHAPSGGGAVQRAGAGTLHVAAVDELPRIMQPTLLRFLDEPRRARVVASATDLLTRVELGVFDVSLAERLTIVELVIG